MTPEDELIQSIELIRLGTALETERIRAATYRSALDTIPTILTLLADDQHHEEAMRLLNDVVNHIDEFDRATVSAS